MPIGERLEAAISAYVEAVAMYEAAKADFEILQSDIAETIVSGDTPTSATLAEEERLRIRVFAAAAAVSRRDREISPRV
jgi:hypothetical protein